MARNSQHHGQSKHIDNRCHFIREKVTEGTIKLKYCPTDRMLAEHLRIMITSLLTVFYFSFVLNLLVVVVRISYFITCLVL